MIQNTRISASLTIWSIAIVVSLLSLCCDRALSQAIEVQPHIEVQSLHISLSGPPGAGKTTHGTRLAARYGIPHISVGAILRREIADRTDLGRKAAPYVAKGELVPTDLIEALIRNRLSQPDCSRGFILDGYPRKMDDLKLFDRILSELQIGDFRLIVLEVKPEILVSRMENRRVCDKGHQYDLITKPPRKEGICDIDGLPIHQRDDDNPVTIRHRFEIFQSETLPVINHYRAKNACVMIDGSGSGDEAYGRLTDLLDPKPEPGAGLTQ